MLQDISASIKAYGVSQGSKKTVERERLAATEACASKTYVVWSSGKDEKGAEILCSRVASTSRCFCGHPYSMHAKSMKKNKFHCKKKSCKCPRFDYVPMSPEEIGEYWLPRRRGFDLGSWRAKCKCGHSHEDHTADYARRCRKCKCSQYRSAWACVVCNKHGEAHETSWETELERKQDRKSVGNAFMPLAEMPQVRADVLRSTRRTLLPAVAMTQIASNRASSGSRLQSKPFSGLVPRPEDSKRRRSHVRSGMSANLPNVADPRLSTSSTQQVKLPNLRVGHKGRSYSLPRSIRQAPWASSSQNRVSPMKPLHSARLPPRNSSDDGTSALASTHFPPKQLGKSRFS
mmetsp:Transcript_26/g.36  ORF Transcript_26/g.36 Transcript_26/m.36 type:complete len:346 (-) Transcript_26:279-1316(-)